MRDTLTINGPFSVFFLPYPHNFYFSNRKLACNLAHISYDCRYVELDGKLRRPSKFPFFTSALLIERNWSAGHSFSRVTKFIILNRLIRSSFSDSVKRKGEKGIRAKEKMGDSVKW